MKVRQVKSWSSHLRSGQCQLSLYRSGQSQVKIMSSNFMSCQIRSDEVLLSSRSKPYHVMPSQAKVRSRSRTRLFRSGLSQNRSIQVRSR